MSLHERAPSSPTASYHPDYFEHAYSDQFVTVIPHHVSPSALPPAAHRVSLKQSPQWPSSFDHRDGEDHRLGSEASSPEGTGSLSGSSTGSYSIPRAALDPVQSYPGKTAGSASFTLASHMEEGSGSNGAVTSAEGHSHKDGSGRASWASRPSQLSGGQSLRSVRHDEQSSVTVYAGTKEKFSYSKEPNAVLALVFLSMPVPLFSLGTCLYTLFALLFVTLSSPLRLCPPTSFFRSTSFSIQLCQLLVPALEYHERLAQKPSSHHHHYHHHHDPYRSDGALTDIFSPARLVLVLLLAPLLSLGLLLAVWTAAFFWIFAMILGNPDGTERRDDGRAAVLGVNGWWQKWLGKSRRKR
ncbi:hypothetical protein VTN96DRAFT_8278 [Rasamsonia emersonii]|uniref:Uncharacterized protein n=1 Tax=Rasamsonia emersonii (strain ATCC 16479 / CBS 393.64 / IMI 116815) TaxID=1408163 RepID=A0A0F4YFY3_RASE3|nr:hypothetical protein T310_9573 [Rasamsonia emersonii CBS 393.64]KKA16856.1 hypothetical protein T310_9573 [Rasamsonia emersonii CBS 393.64]